MLIPLTANNISNFYSDLPHFQTNLSQNHIPINLFIRHSFTEANNSAKTVIQDVINIIMQMNGKPYPLKVLNGLISHSQENICQSFEQQTGLEFNPINFCSHRLKLLNQADAMIIIRTSTGESNILEIAYNIFASCKMPMFFAVWRNAPIKTTLIRDLDELCASTYVTFDYANELRAPLVNFLAQLPLYRSLTA